MEYVVIVYENKNNEYVGIVPDIKDCIAYGETFEEFCEAVEDVAELCLEDENLPLANSIEYFTNKVLAEYFIPMENTKYIIKIIEDGSQSYDAHIVL